MWGQGLVQGIDCCVEFTPGTSHDDSKLEIRIAFGPIQGFDDVSYFVGNSPVLRNRRPIRKLVCVGASE